MVKRVLNVLYREVKGLHQAAYVLALFALASQILAVVRDRILAHQFGAGYELDVYYAAFRVPDLLFTLFASVLSVYVLLPFVARNEEREEGSGKIVLQQVFSLFLFLYLFIGLVAALFAPVIVNFLFTGFSEQAIADIVLLLRILLLQPLLLGVSSLFGVVTQMNHRVVLYALSPLLYNLGIIFGVAFLYQYMGVSGIAVGVVLGAFGHMAVQWPLVKTSKLNFGATFKFDWFLLRQIGKVALPRAVTLSLGQVQILIFTILASMFTVGSVAVLQLAYNLQSVPLAIVGMSYSVAAFPVLAELLAKNEFNKFSAYVTTAMRHIIFWAVPITALVIVLRAQIVRVLLGSGSFNWDDTRLTAAVLSIFVVSLLGQAILLLLVRAFYAGGKTKIPLIVTALGVSIGTVSAYGLGYLYSISDNFANFAAGIFRLDGVQGVEVLMIPMGFLLGVIIECVVLIVLFAREFSLSYRILTVSFARSLVAALVGASFAYGALVFIVEGVNQEKFIGIFIQGLAGGVTGIFGVVATYAVLRSPELAEITKSFKSKIWKTDVVAPQPDII